MGKNFNYLKVLTILFVFIFISQINAQNDLGIVGKVITLEEAEELFGQVDEQIEVRTTALQQVLTHVPKYVLMRLENGKLGIYNEKRKGIGKGLGKGNPPVGPTEKLHVYSKSKVLEVIQKGKAPITAIQKRGDKMTVQNGVYVLEYATFCPPFCIDW